MSSVTMFHSDTLRSTLTILDFPYYQALWLNWMTFLTMSGILTVLICSRYYPSLDLHAFTFRREQYILTLDTSDYPDTKKSSRI
jgi:hypothetical protein